MKTWTRFLPKLGEKYSERNERGCMGVDLDKLTVAFGGPYHPTMNQQVTIEEHEMPPDLARMFAQARRNLLWFSENAERIGVYQNCRGRYVAAVGGELLVADTPEEVRALAQRKHPEEMPHVRYIPREKRYRIYAN
ncbi:MAG: hypothetical protein QOH70_3698 [Blastocatellia bacterium]|nr:hypothetical protein [Blastocatellia bacterium]